MSSLAKKRPSEGSASVTEAAQKQNVVKTLSNVVKNFFPRGINEMDFAGEPEDVAAKHCNFLSVWFPLCKNSNKELERKAFQEACGQKVSKHVVETCVGKCSMVRKVVLRKNRNSKTGANMPEWCRLLLAALVPGETVAMAAAKAMPKSRALPVAQPSSFVPPVPSLQQAESVALLPGLEEAQSPATPEVALTQDTIVTVPSSVASSPVVALALPVEGTPLKKPAAVLKKPACLKVKATRAASAWVQSGSFGEMKLTVAKAKSYIQARDAPGDKPYCLVNIQGDGIDHASIAERVMTYAKGAGLNKAQVVDYKNKLL